MQFRPATADGACTQRSHRLERLLVLAAAVAMGCANEDEGGAAGEMPPFGSTAGAAAAPTAGTSTPPLAGAAGAPVGGAAGTGAAGVPIAGSAQGTGGADAALAGAAGPPVAGVTPIAGTAGAAATGGVGADAGGTAAAGAGGEPGAGAGGASADGGAGGSADPPLPECDLSAAPDDFEPNASVGGGGSAYTDSPHFRIYGTTGSAADDAIQHLEAAYACFVETLCWRSSGLSIRDDTDSGPYYKMNIYSVGNLPGAAGVMQSDFGTGLSYLEVGSSYLSQPRVTVHEYGHALTYHERGWIDQTRTGAWWETVANFVADTYLTSRLCEEARKRFGVAEGTTVIELDKVIGESHHVIVDGSQGSGNYYQAWPFLTYLTNNPDGYDGLGPTALRDMFRNHMGNNETPLHVLERIASVSVQTIVGRYWARMAYLDIAHPQAQEAFLNGGRSEIRASLDPLGSDSYRVRGSLQPQYFGANIIPLDGTGTIAVQVTSGAPFTATLAIHASDDSVRYVELADGWGEALVDGTEDATLVVANTPDELELYDPFSIGANVATGLDYQLQITGAVPAN